VVTASEKICACGFTVLFCVANIKEKRLCEMELFKSVPRRRTLSFWVKGRDDDL
jgi:hypothetical protein